MPGRDLQALYKDVVMDHFRQPRRFMSLPPPAHAFYGKNPLCGDECQIWVDETAPEHCRVAFTGSGCALSMASASILAAFADGQSREALARMADDVLAVLAGEKNAEALTAYDEQLVALAGVLSFPVRKKCVQLPWQSLRKGLVSRPGVVVTTE